MKTDSYQTAENVPHYIPLDLLEEEQGQGFLSFLRR